MPKNVDRNDLLMIADIVKSEIERTMEDSCADYSGWIYRACRALANVVSDLGHKGLNPFNEDDWNTITRGE
jgi:hypothetical protein